MNLLAELVGNQVVYALGWTLLHSLWQVGLIAILTGLLHFIGASWSANSRYLIALSGLGLAALISASTFIYYLGAVNEAVAWADKTSLVAVHILQMSSQASTLLKLKIFLNQHLTQIVVFWSIGFGVYLARYAIAFLHCQHLKHSRTSTVPKFWQTRIEQMRRQLAIAKPVAMKLSQRVQSPCVVGHIKPLVLVPIAFLTHLDTEQVEAILFHELGHIRRHDYFVSLLQNLLKTIYFFNPFVLWISARVDSERENACDDIAVENCKDPLLYAKALEQFTNIPINGGLAMAATGKHQHIFMRIKRLFERKATGAGPLEGVIASFVIALCCVVATVNAQTNNSADDDHKYTGISTLEPGEVEGLIEDYASQILSSDDPSFVTSIEIRDEIQHLSGDELAIFVGHLKERVWQETYGSWEPPERFAHLASEEWIQLSKLWLDDNFGHHFDYLESYGEGQKVATINALDGTKAAKAAIFGSGHRTEFVLPIALVRKLSQDGGALRGDTVQATENGKGGITLLVDKTFGQVDFKTLGKIVPKAHSPGEYQTWVSDGDDDTRMGIHVSKNYMIVELEKALIDGLLEGTTASIGNGRMGAQTNSQGDLVVAVEPGAFKANRNMLLEFLPPVVWDVPDQLQDEVKVKLAQVPQDMKNLLPTPQEWNRMRLAQELQRGREISEPEWTLIKNHMLNHELDVILDPEAQPERFKSRMADEVRYVVNDSGWIAIRDPGPPDVPGSAFDIDVRELPFAEVVDLIRSYCPDSNFSPSYSEKRDQITVIEGNMTCERAESLLPMISENIDNRI